MKAICKCLIAIIISTLLLASLSACFKPEVTDSGESTPYETLPSSVASSIGLVENGNSVFKVVVPQYYTDAEYSHLEKFVSSFKSKTGITLRYVSEAAAPYENDDYEILIGQVDRKESEEIFSQLRDKEYFYGVVGNKLVISGKTDFELDDAIQLFLRKIVDTAIAVDELNITVSSEINYFYRYDYLLQNVLMGDSPISNYSIVYSKNDSISARNFATQLANLISSTTGIQITVVDDSNTTTSHEIVVGDTLRGTPITAAKDSFSAICKDGKLYLGSAYAYGYDLLYSYVSKLFLKASTDTVTFDDVFSYEESYASSLTGGTENMLGKSGSVRVIFHNVLIHDRDNAPTALRAQYSLDVYRDYAPDIIGLQEMQYSIRNAIAPGLKALGYTEVPYTERNSTFKVVEDPIFYNPETLTLITSGAYRFDEKRDKNKCIGWALFEEKATGKRFIVASTHFAWLSDPEEAAELRLKHAGLTAQEIPELAARFNLPIIIGGDFNCNNTSEPYSILSEAGMIDVEILAQKTENMATHHSEPAFDTKTQLCIRYSFPSGGNGGDQAIDHIFAHNATNVTFNTYDVITDKIALATSDHCPLLVDFTLG